MDSSNAPAKKHLAGLVFIAAVVAMIALAAWHLASSPSSKPSGKPRVIATFSILGDLVHQVAGENIDLLVLVGPDGDAHTFEPTISDAASVASASLIFENGLGFETWLDKLCQSSRTKALRIDTSEGIKSHHMEDPNAPAASIADNHAPTAPSTQAAETDPHMWHDVKNVIIITNHIAAALAEADPSHADEYKANAAAYITKLEALDAEIISTMSTLPQASRKLVTTHDALGYYARRYGLVILGSGLDSISTESADPSAREMLELINRIKTSGVPTIFLENIQNAKLMNQIAAEAHVKIGPPLFTDALGKPGTEGDSYIKLMHYNTTSIVNGLKP